MFPVAEIEASLEAETPSSSRFPELLKVKLPLLAEPWRDLTVLVRSSLTSVPAATSESVVSAAVWAWVTAPPATMSIKPQHVRVIPAPSSPP